ncbi:hypothetical protein Tco_1462827 [Tanacetum coccineum]
MCMIGIQTRLVAGIDHGKAGRGLADVAAYDPSMEVRYVFAVLAFCDLDFNLLSQLELQKDASIADIMNSLRLEGPYAKTTKASCTSEVPATIVATTTLSISVTAASASSIPPISVADYDVMDAEIQGEVPHSPKIVFENETLDTTPERPTAN